MEKDEGRGKEEKEGVRGEGGGKKGKIPFGKL